MKICPYVCTRCVYPAYHYCDVSAPTSKKEDTDTVYCGLLEEDVSLVEVTGERLIDASVRATEDEEFNKFWRGIKPE